VADLHLLTESVLTQILGFNTPLKIRLLRKIRVLSRVLLMLRLLKIGLLKRVLSKPRLLKPRLLKIRLLITALLRAPVDITLVAVLSGCARNGKHRRQHNNSNFVPHTLSLGLS
jgi:hypothetical protein